MPRARATMPFVFLGIAGLLVLYGFFLHLPLNAIGTYPYALRLVFSFALVFPPAFLMGFPMPVAMASLARLKKEHMFLWAWGINGCFSVIGAAVVPIAATAFGLSSVLFVGAGAISSRCGLLRGAPADPRDGGGLARHHDPGGEPSRPLARLSLAGPVADQSRSSIAGDDLVFAGKGGLQPRAHANLAAAREALGCAGPRCGGAARSIALRRYARPQGRSGARTARPRPEPAGRPPWPRRRPT